MSQDLDYTVVYLGVSNGLTDRRIFRPVVQPLLSYHIQESLSIKQSESIAKRLSIFLLIKYHLYILASHFWIED